MATHDDNLTWFQTVKPDGRTTPQEVAEHLAPFGVRVKWDGTVPVQYFTHWSDPDRLMMEVGTVTYSERNGVWARPRAGLNDRGVLQLLLAVEPLAILGSPRGDKSWARHRSSKGTWWSTCVSVPVPRDLEHFRHLMAANPFSADGKQWSEHRDQQSLGTALFQHSDGVSQ